ncbi:type II toxin-antitoxin system RelE/ParE family toxin [Devosia sp. BK]|uniref:type II toxin-antitoxin system RelE/ParE family toxin n=1 Tax=Devosia sp. BK TaxID=2871706 RepID=UPI00293AFCAA|nr:type II toxin-antitoxin system RelE/ParE family toxin [Devosia sp. BK]MDV3251137.1 type II toxin-antitoxin system RelE/ParE family toxin [Devosia sp. BK]
MTKATVRPKAMAWFLAQIDEIAKDSPNAADALLDRFEEILRLVGENPRAFQRGKIRDTRYINMPPFVMTWRQKNGQVEIGAIRHGRQRDAYRPTSMRAKEAPTADEVSKLTLAARIVQQALRVGSELPGEPDEVTRYLSDIAEHHELRAMLDDVSDMEDFVDFMSKHSIHFPKSGLGW